MYPLPPEILEGKRILLILIPRDTPTVAQFVAGEARWLGGQLYVEYDPGLRAVRAEGSRGGLTGCDPARLDRFVVPEALSRIEPLARDIAAWVAVFAAERLPDVLTLSLAFFGLAENGEGDVLLMEGAPDDAWDEEDDEDWEPQEPWRQAPGPD